MTIKKYFLLKQVWLRVVCSSLFTALILSIVVAAAAQPVAAHSASDLRLHGKNLNPIQIDPGQTFSRESFTEWLNEESSVSFSKMLANISLSDAAVGSVMASPQRAGPNYYYHWVRDAALTMDVVVRNYIASDSQSKLHWWRMISDYIDFSRQNQLAPTLTGLGEPKFNSDGSPYMLDWGRPQNDGPALRALTLTRFAQQLISEGQWAYVRDRLYDSSIPAKTVIKADLEYVSHHWNDPSFDLWEEVKGDHFYTRIVQLSALRNGAQLARQLGDGAAADFYLSQADQVQVSLRSFWSVKSGFIRATLNRLKGGAEKSGLDTAVVLGVLHAHLPSGEFSVTDPQVYATVQRLESAFAATYEINISPAMNDLGTAIGRYPEDIYSGTDGLYQGNPWILTTNALAEYYYRLAAAVALRESGTDKTDIDGGIFGNPQNPTGCSASELLARGDQFLNRTRFHENPDGSLSEQMDRYTGRLRSARDLTWSYASLITATWARPR